MWTDEEAVQLAEALPLAREVRFLNLWGNDKIGARGLEALAAAIREGAAPKLETFKFDSNRGAEGAALRAACEGRGVAVKMEVHVVGIRRQEALEIARQLSADCSSLGVACWCGWWGCCA